MACLDPDSTRAGEKYDALREALVKIIDWWGAPFPEELVDEAFNRLTRKLKDGGTICGWPT